MNRMKRSWILSAALSASLLIAPALAGAQDDLVAMSEDPNQWVIPLGNYHGTRHSTLDQINSDNVDRLRVSWTMSTGALRGHEGQPLIIGDMMYFQSAYPNHVYAVDLNDIGRIAWQFTPEQNTFAPSVACCDLVNRGVAYGDGMILVAALDTTLYALDAETGAIVWTAQNGDPNLGQTMTMAPLVVGDKVIAGISGGEFGVRGYVTGFDLRTGTQLWRAHSVGPDEEILFDPETTIDAATQQPVGENSSLRTWENEEWQLGGGTTWGWYTYDPELNLFYYGSGNPGTWNPSQRPGDNKWSTTIFARNPDTGMAAWAYQMTPHDMWDYDGINEMVLTETEVDGETLPTLTHFDRNGFAYLMDRRDGRLLRAHTFDPSVNWATGINMETGRPEVVPEKETEADRNVTNICPAAQGAKNQQPASYDPETRLFYLGTNHICMDYQAFSVRYRAGFPYVGAIVSMYPANNGDIRGRVIAFDPVTGETQWENNETFQAYSGPLSTSGNLVIYGTLDGWLKAADKQTGEVLYEFRMPSGVIANPITYMHDGTQYIAVLSGVGGWAALGLAEGLTQGTEGLGAVGLTRSLGDYTNLGGTLVVFELGN